MAITGLKPKNRNAIYRYIHNSRRVSKQDIIRSLQLSLPTVTQNIEDLQAQGLLIENGSFGSTGGRRAKGYSINPNAKIAIGLELCTGHVGIALLDLSGKIIAHDRFQIPYSKNELYYQRIGGITQTMVQSCQLKESQVLGVGISVQGVPAADGSAIQYGGRLNNTGETLTNIAEFIPYPCKLFHDADSGAFAEMWMDPELVNAVYLSLSTHLGISVIINRSIYKGQDSFAGKIEHLTLVPEGALCDCGKRGCAGVYCTSMALTSSVPEKQLPNFFRQLTAGSPLHLQLWASYTDYLAILLHNLRITFGSPVILGGDISLYLEDHLDALRQKVYSRHPFTTGQDYLQLGSFPAEAAASGSALQLLEAFIQKI